MDKEKPFLFEDVVYERINPTVSQHSSHYSSDPSSEAATESSDRSSETYTNQFTDQPPEQENIPDPPFHTWTYEYPVLALSYARDGQTLAVGYDKTVDLYKPVSGAHLHQFLESGFISALAFTPDSRSLAIGSTHIDPDILGLVRVFDLEKRRLRYQMTYPHPLRLVRFNERYLVVGVSDDDDFFSQEGALYVYHNGEVLRHFEYQGSIFDFAWTKEGCLVGYSDSQGSVVESYNLDSGNRTWRLTFGEAGTNFTLSADEKYLAVCCEDGSVRLFERPHERVVYSWSFSQPVRQALFAPDGRIIFCRDEKIEVHKITPVEGDDDPESKELTEFYFPQGRLPEYEHTEEQSLVLEEEIGLLGMRDKMILAIGESCAVVYEYPSLGLVKEWRAPVGFGFKFGGLTPDGFGGLLGACDAEYVYGKAVLMTLKE